jgi:hypothetical protein
VLLLRYNLLYNLDLLLGSEGFLKLCYPLILRGEKGDQRVSSATSTVRAKPSIERPVTSC